MSWSVPATDGGSPITAYNVYRGTSAGGESATPVATNVTTTSFTDTGVTNGTQYFYTVAAVNAVGIVGAVQRGIGDATGALDGRVRAAGGFGDRRGEPDDHSVPIAAPGVTAGDTLVVNLLLSTPAAQRRGLGHGHGRQQLPRGARHQRRIEPVTASWSSSASA